MTPTELVTAARDLYNASGDSFFSDLQIYNWIWEASHIMAKDAWIIERKYDTSTVAGTADYAYPSNTIAIKRVTVNGRKIKRITHRYDDAITLSNSTSGTTGYPVYYTDFNYTLSLRPIPDSVYTLEIFSYNDAQQITAISPLEIPPLFHFDIVDYVLYRMFSKDKDTGNAGFHMQVWQQHVASAKAYKNRRKITDSFATVQSEDVLPTTIVGEA